MACNGDWASRIARALKWRDGIVQRYCKNSRAPVPKPLFARSELGIDLFGLLHKFDTKSAIRLPCHPTLANRAGSVEGQFYVVRDGGGIFDG